MEIVEQNVISSRVKSLLTRYGLKQNFIADTCKIRRPDFSMFMHSKLALSDRQIGRVIDFIDDYERRNGQ